MTHKPWVIRTVVAALVCTAWLTAAGAVPAGASGTPAPRSAAPAAKLAYSLLTAGGQVVGFGGSFNGSVDAPDYPVVAVASTPDGRGALAAESNGGVIPLGDGQSAGDMSGVALDAPVEGIAIDPRSGGYWMVAADGGIFTFGGASFFGSKGNSPLPAPIAAMAATPDGQGYWLVTSTGVVYPFGDARSYGDMGGIRLNRPVVGMASTPDGKGYWMVASDGGIFTFGDAPFFGSTGSLRLWAPVIGMSPTADGKGYWMVASDGGVFTFGDAPFLGSGVSMGEKVLGITTGLAVNPVVPPPVYTGYVNPFRAVRLTSMRIDEGVDYGGNGPVYALGDGVVLSTTGPWPGGAFTTYRLIDGPAAGKLVYVAENFTPSVAVGQTVDANTVLGQMHGTYPYIETGWAADQYGDTMAASYNEWNSTWDAASDPTAFGVNFNQFLVSLGAPSGVMVHPDVVGALPAGWPTW